MMEYVINEKEDSSKQVTYGIDILSDNIVTESVRDICENREKIERLIYLLNTLEVEKCHFECIIEDFLTDFQV